MSLEHITAPDAPPPGGSYSHGVVANGFLYTCGMGPVDPKTGEIPEGIEAQVRSTLRNLQAILRVKGADFSQVVKVTTHLQNSNADFAAYDKVYQEFFPAPRPVRTTVGSDLANILVEIDLVVAL
ncbi:MAG: RidA family protein [Actinobacteria bacterium]|nr:RidA family protein [Actinomycetota bacterium]